MPRNADVTTRKEAVKQLAARPISRLYAKPMTRILNSLSAEVTAPDTFGIELKIREESNELSADLLAGFC